MEKIKSSIKTEQNKARQNKAKQSKQQPPSQKYIFDL